MAFETDFDDSLESLVREAFDFMAADLRVALPGTIESIVPGTRLVNVRPMIATRYYERDEITDLPIIQRVPLVEPRTASAFISLPIKRGDPVLMVFGDRALENWIKSDGSIPVEPLDIRQHDLTDAFAIIGGWPEAMTGNRPGENPDDLDIQVEPGVKILIGNGADELLDILDQIVDLFENVSTGIMTSYQTHNHAGGANPPTDAATWASALSSLTAIRAKLSNLKK